MLIDLDTFAQQHTKYKFRYILSLSTIFRIGSDKAFHYGHVIIVLELNEHEHGLHQFSYHSFVLKFVDAID